MCQGGVGRMTGLETQRSTAGTVQHHTASQRRQHGGGDFGVYLEQGLNKERRAEGTWAEHGSTERGQMFEKRGKSPRAGPQAVRLKGSWGQRLCHRD